MGENQEGLLLSWDHKGSRCCSSSTINSEYKGSLGLRSLRSRGSAYSHNCATGDQADLVGFGGPTRPLFSLRSANKGRRNEKLKGCGVTSAYSSSQSLDCNGDGRRETALHEFDSTVDLGFTVDSGLD